VEIEARAVPISPARLLNGLGGAGFRLSAAAGVVSDMAEYRGARPAMRLAEGPPDFRSRDFRGCYYSGFTGSNPVEPPNVVSRMIGWWRGPVIRLLRPAEFSCDGGTMAGQSCNNCWRGS
jgi:hypothetical protein